jgi:hypothetical protein
MLRMVILFGFLVELSLFAILLVMCITFGLRIAYILLLIPAGCALFTVNESRRLGELSYTMLPLATALKEAKEVALRSLRNEESAVGRISVSDAESALQLLETISRRSSLFGVNPLQRRS